jgi:hypothetical protein
VVELIEEIPKKAMLEDCEWHIAIDDETNA